MNRQALPPETVGELVGLLSAATVNGNRTELAARILALHRDGWPYTTIAEALNQPAGRIKAMAQKADREKS